LKLLVVDAYAREGRAALRAAGGTEAGVLYERMLRVHAGDLAIDVVYPADTDRDLPTPAELADYDGVAWTGSSLTILDDGDPRVKRQLELARAAYAARVPSFGSCCAIQTASVAAGGRCAASSLGREFGAARRIELDPDARSHPLYRDKPAVFDAFTSHADEVVELPPCARLLASNDWSRVQAADIEHDSGSFWAVQYHPEYDLHEVASLCRLRADELVTQGSFPDRTAADHYAEKLEVLHADPADSDLASALEIGPSLLDPHVRTLEVRNWLEHLRTRNAP